MKAVIDVWQPSKAPSLQDWNFEACPIDRLHYCFAYEYCRHIPTVVEAFKRAKAKQQAGKPMDKLSCFDKNGNWRYPFIIPPLIEGGNSQAVVLHAPPGFPDKPYLQIKHVIDGSNPLHPFVSNKIALWEVRKRADSRYVFVDGPSPAMVRIYKSGTAELCSSTLSQNEVYHFSIDWSCSRTSIVAAFNGWLKKNQPKANQRNVDIGRYQADLKALGAYRLLRCRKTITSAIAYSQLARTAKGLCGTSVFVDDSSWTDAKQRAEAIIEDWKRQIPFTIAPRIL